MLAPTSQSRYAHRGFRFGEFVLDLGRESVSRAGDEIRLRPKAFAVLAHLVQHHGRLVTKDELLDSVWGHSHVTEGSITQCLIDIRRALGDKSHEMIRTVPKRGFIFELEVVPEPVSTPDGRRSITARKRYVIAAVGALLLMVLGGWWGARQVGPGLLSLGTIGQPAPTSSIAVLPFKNMSADERNEYFADGLTEEILNSLTQVPGLKVIARTSSFVFKGVNADIPTVAKKLDVAYVMEGSVRKSGDMVRVTAQLVDARTDTQVWSRTFDRELGDVFAVQTEIAGLVSETLKLSRSGHDPQGNVRPPDPRAYEHYLRGEYFWQRRSAGDMALAEQEFRKAVSLDPGFARAWVGLAGTFHARLVGSDSPPRDDELARFHDMLKNAIAADPDLAEAHVRLVNYYYLVGDGQASLKEWEKAQALDPDNSLVLAMGAGWALWRGLYLQAIDLGRKVAELDPLSAVAHGNLSAILLAAGRVEESESELRKSMQLSPDLRANQWDFQSPSGCLSLIMILQHRYSAALKSLAGQPDGPGKVELQALAYWGLGRETDFERLMAGLTEDDPVFLAIRRSEVAAFRGDREEAFRLLRSANAQLPNDAMNARVDKALTEIRISPLFIALRGDPRWAALWEKWEAWM